MDVKRRVTDLPTMKSAILIIPTQDKDEGRLEDIICIVLRSKKWCIQTKCKQPSASEEL